MPDALKISIRKANGVQVIALGGELDLATAGALSSQLAETQASLVVVDLADLSFLDSSGISCLVLAKTQMDDEGRTLIFTRPQPRVERALEIVGLADWLTPWSSEWA